MLEAFEIGAHVLTPPRAIISDPRDLIPITAWPANGDHRVVNCAAAYRSRSRIKDPVSFVIPLGVRLLWVGVMFNKELPTEVWVFAGVRMKRGNLRDFWRIPSARLEDKNSKAILGKVKGERSAAGAGADDDEVGLCCLLFWVKSGVSHLSEDMP